MPQKVLNDDWSYYDNRKKKGEDARYFSCVESWEREYLKEKIKHLYPGFSDVNIEKAIVGCCQTVESPRPRKEFVECVMRRLRA